MLYNGFGEHNIQGIGDKHIPLIHNVMNTDAACAVSDRATDALDLLFNASAGLDTSLTAERSTARSSTFYRRWAYPVSATSSARSKPQSTSIAVRTM